MGGEVPGTGVEPARPRARDPKSRVSTNSTIPATYGKIRLSGQDAMGKGAGGVLFRMIRYTTPHYKRDERCF